MRLRMHVLRDRTNWDLDVNPQMRSKSLTLGRGRSAIISGFANH